MTGESEPHTFRSDIYMGRPEKPGNQKGAAEAATLRQWGRNGGSRKTQFRDMVEKTACWINRGDTSFRTSENMTSRATPKNRILSVSGGLDVRPQRRCFPNSSQNRIDE